MAGAGITIGVAADTREAAKGATDLAKGFDQVADTLDDVAKSSTKAGDKLEASMRDAQRETKDTATAFKQLAREQRDAASAGGEDFSRVTKKSMKDSSEAVKEFSGEAKQNIGETFSSFRGDASDFAQVAQDTLGGLTSGLEGIPAVAAVAAGAAGIGLILGAMEDGQVKSEAWKQAVADLTQQFIEAGREGPEALEAAIDKLKQLASSTDDAGLNLDKLNKLSSRSGDTFEDVARAYAGNTDALKEIVKAGDARIKQLTDESNRIDTADDAQRKRYGTMIDEIQAQSELNNYLDDASKKAEEAAKNAELYAKSGAAEMEAKAEQIRNVDQAYDDAAAAIDDYTNAETGVFDVDKYIAAMTEKAQALDGFKTNMQQAALTLSPEAVTFLQAQGVDAASRLVQSYLKGTQDQQQQLNSVWTTAGKTSADSYTGALKSNLPDSVQGPKIIIDDVDTSRIGGQIQSYLNGQRFTVNAWANPRVGSAVQ